MAELIRERGAAAVEMAFVVMLLILLVTGIADLGRAIFTYIGVQDAAQEGAMYASYNSADVAGIKQRAQASVDYPKLELGDIHVKCDAPSYRTITVTVSHTVDLITPVIGQLFGGTIQLQRSFTGDVFAETCDEPSP